MTEHTHDMRQPAPANLDDLYVHLVTGHGQDNVGKIITADGTPGLVALHGELHPGSRPAVYPFTYYLHDDGDLVDHLTDPPDPGVFTAIPLDIAKQIADEKPFYEVTFRCEYDVAAREVRLLSASLDDAGQQVVCVTADDLSVLYQAACGSDDWCGHPMLPRIGALLEATERKQT